MKSVVTFLSSIFLSIFFLSANSSFAAEQKDGSKAEEAAPKVERIGGTFVVESIKPLKDGGFKVQFVAKEGTPRFKTLTLESSHVHMAIAQGATLRLSADVIATSGNAAEVSQVVIYVPSKTGDTPVWMLSRRATVPNPPAKLLEMHAPQTDYQVF